MSCKLFWPRRQYAANCENCSYHGRIQGILLRPERFAASISVGKYQREKVRFFSGADGKKENGPGEGPAFASKIENRFECFL